MNLRINKDIYGLGVANPATNQEITSFCSSNSYEANTLRGSAKSLSGEIEVSENDIANDLNTSNQIDLYPNPASKLVLLNSSDLNISIITLHDLSGRVLKQENLPGQTRLYQMSLAGIAPGTYIVRVDCVEEVFTEKLVVTK